MIIVNSPNNPSGSVYNENELRQIGKMLMDYPKILFCRMKFMNILIMD